MNNSYSDIRSKISEEPLWWDEHAVPRYCEFHPHETANIYAHTACLLLIECQSCGHQFKVCMSESFMDIVHRDDDGEFKIWDNLQLTHLVKEGILHYGDPPNACPPHCAAGATMNSIPLRVLEFWQQNKAHKWIRKYEYEVDVKPEWAKNDS